VVRGRAEQQREGDEDGELAAEVRRDLPQYADEGPDVHYDLEHCDEANQREEELHEEKISGGRAGLRVALEAGRRPRMALLVEQRRFGGIDDAAHRRAEE